jgi:hypothetical protein
VNGWESVVDVESLALRYKHRLEFERSEKREVSSEMDGWCRSDHAVINEASNDLLFCIRFVSYSDLWFMMRAWYLGLAGLLRYFRPAVLIPCVVRVASDFPSDIHSPLPMFDFSPRYCLYPLPPFA